MADRLISITEAAELLGITRQAVFAAIKRGDLEATQVGRQWVLQRSVVDRYTVNRTLQSNASQRRRRTAEQKRVQRIIRRHAKAPAIQLVGQEFRLSPGLATEVAAGRMDIHDALGEQQRRDAEPPAPSVQPAGSIEPDHERAADPGADTWVVAVHGEAFPGTPGDRNIGVVLHRGTEEILAFGESAGAGRSEEAAFLSVIRALEEASRRGAPSIRVLTAAEDMVKQLSGVHWLTDKSLHTLFMKALKLARGFAAVEWRCAPDDGLVRSAMSLARASANSTIGLA